jgi:hypothetical protein
VAPVISTDFCFAAASVVFPSYSIQFPSNFLPEQGSIMLPRLLHGAGIRLKRLFRLGRHMVSGRLGAQNKSEANDENAA